MDDVTLSSAVCAMPLGDFLRMLNNPSLASFAKIKSKLIPLIILYAIYRQWARASRAMPLYELRVDVAKDLVESCPIKVDEWAKVLQCAMKELKVDPQLGSESSSLAGQPSVPTWKQLLALETSAVDLLADTLPRILEDIIYLLANVVPQACKSLRELLLSAKVDSRLANRLPAIRQPAQLAPAVKQVMSRLPPNVQQGLMPRLREWCDLSYAVSPMPVSFAERPQFLRELKGPIYQATQQDWFDVAFVPILDDGLPRRPRGPRRLPICCRKRYAPRVITPKWGTPGLCCSPQGRSHVKEEQCLCLAAPWMPRWHLPLW